MCGTGLPAPVPASAASLRLSTASSYNTARPIAPGVGVENLTSLANTYIVTVSLLQNGSPLATQSQNVTVAAGGSVTLGGFDFGTRPAGSYRLRAELRLGNTLLDTQSADITVLDTAAQQLAEDEAEKLKGAARNEFDQMAGIPARTFAKDVVSFTLDKIEDATLNHLLEVIAPFKSPSPDSIIAKIRNALADIKVRKAQMARRTSLQIKSRYGLAVPADFDPLNPVFQEFISDPLLLNHVKNTVGNIVGDEVKEGFIKPLYTAPEMDRVESRDAQFRDYLATHSVSGQASMRQTFDRGKDLIANTVESDAIFTVGPYSVPVLGTLQYKATLLDEQNVHDLLTAKLKLLLVILVLVGLVLLFTGVGTAIGAVVWKVALLLGSTWLKVLAIGVATFLMLFSVQKIAPHVTARHNDTLNEIEALIGSQGQALRLSGFEIAAGRSGQPTRLSARVESEESARTVDPVVETTIYSADGRVVQMLWSHPTLRLHQTALLEKETTLPAGRYRAVSVVHSGEQIAIAGQTQTFAVASAALHLDVRLDKPLFTAGEAVHATISITNSDVISDANDLTLIVDSGDGQDFNAWPLNLPAGQSQQVDYTFVPPAEGGYVLQAILSVGLNELTGQDVAYVVGTGASLALNTDGQDIYQPGNVVTLPITATNDGNVPTSTVLSLVTLDRLHDLAAVYTNTIPLDLGSGAVDNIYATALPAAQARPGLYSARLFLDGDLYSSLDFAVAAEDTLFADIYADNVFYGVGDPVTLTVQVMNSAYTYTDALVDVSLWRPDGITQTVTMNSTGSGQYQGTVTAPITGTYLAAVAVGKPNYRAVGNSTFFVAGERSQLLPSVDGQPILGITAPVTMTVRNEQGVPVAGASLVVSGTLEHLSSQTGGAGQVVLHLSPTITEPYPIRLEKLGFAQTTMDLPVWVVSDTTPPPLFLDAPPITNHSSLTVTGLTEAAASLKLNDQAVSVDTRGLFTTTVSLNEGANTLIAAATDAFSNTTTVTRSVTLDTVPPTLTVTYPPDGLVTTGEVISATGSTEVGAGITVSGTVGTVDPASGVFNAWVLLHSGTNLVPVTATDTAGNTTTVTRTVTASSPTREHRLYLPLVVKG